MSSSTDSDHVGRIVTMRLFKIAEVRDVLDSVDHVGNELEIFERIKWVRRPGNEKTDIVWWPGLLYESFSELMSDLHHRLHELRGGCLVSHKKTISTKPSVVYMLGSSRPIAVSIAYKYKPSASEPFGCDGEGRDGPELKNYYDQYEHMQDLAKNATAATDETKEEFRRCVDFVDRLMEKEDQNFLLEDGDSGGAQMLQIQNGDAGTSNVVPSSVPSEAKGALKSPNSSDGDKDGAHDNGDSAKAADARIPGKNPVDLTTPPNNLVNVKVIDIKRPIVPPQAVGKVGKELKSTTPKTAANTPSPASTRFSDSTSDMLDNWRELWRQLKLKGWTVRDARSVNNLHNWYWIRPGCQPTSDDCELGVHYFASEREVISYLGRERKKKKLKEAPPTASKMHFDENSAMSSISSISATSSSVAKTTMKQIRRMARKKADWTEIWKLLNQLGWHWNHGRGLIDTYYMKPGKTSNDVIGEDYFTAPEAVMEYLTKQERKMQHPIAQRPTRRCLNSDMVHMTQADDSSDDLRTPPREKKKKRRRVHINAVERSWAGK